MRKYNAYSIQFEDTALQESQVTDSCSMGASWQGVAAVRRIASRRRRQLRDTTTWEPQPGLYKNIDSLMKSRNFVVAFPWVMHFTSKQL